MADVQPLRALHYDLARTGGLQPVAAPPYDVIDDAERAALVAASPYNVVEIDLPRDPDGGDPYAHAARTLETWERDGVVVRDAEPALWALEQDYTGPDGRRRTRRGFLARVRVEDYGPGRIRPHERTHPGPKEDRLRLTRATNANLSPIFSLYDDPAGAAWGALAPHATGEPWGEVEDGDGTIHRVWRVGDPAVADAVHAALADAELLIADGHHRYETARVHARESGDPGAGWVLMCLVALQDAGLTVFPTHRLLTGLDERRRAELHRTIARDFTAQDVPAEQLEPTGDGPVRMGFLDAADERPKLLTLRDPAVAAAALPGKPEPYRELDTAVLEGVVLRGALDMTEDDISHLRGLDYARDAKTAETRVHQGEADAAFFMRGTPVEQVRAVAAAGESMPPKSTYFFPKVLTGIVFNVLREPE
jgi:uncharacterized protein (DUF1015 family)